MPITEDNYDFFVDVNNGAPGAIPALSLAADLFPSLRKRVLETAVLAGQALWEEGLLLKGNGLT